MQVSSEVVPWSLGFWMIDESMKERCCGPLECLGIG